MGTNLVNWFSKKQPAVANTEAEYQALANTTSEVRGLCLLLRDLGIQIKRPPIIYCGNKSTLYLASNPVGKNRTRHVDMEYHFVRKLIERGVLHVSYIPTDCQVADIFTKGLIVYSSILSSSR